jgi:hypothetical protein
VPEPSTFAVHIAYEETAQRSARACTYLRLPLRVKDMPWLSKELKAMLAEIKKAV